MGLRVRQRQLPRHRRHRRGRPGPPAGGPWLSDGQAWNPPSTGASNGCWGCSPPMVVGCVRRRQHADALPGAAVLRLRRGHRPSERRRDRSRGGDARLGGSGGRAGHSGACPGWPGTRSETARGSGGGEGITYTARAAIAAAVAAGIPGTIRRFRPGSGGWESIRTRTAVGAKISAPTKIVTGSAGDEHRLSDGVGTSPSSRRSGVRLRRPGCGVAVRDPAALGNLGRARVHGNRIPRRLLHQLPPVPFGLSSFRPSVGISAGSVRRRERERWAERVTTRR